MRHGKRFNHLGRKAPHRKAMLSNMASSLILNKRITTTVAKAKALRQYVEPLLTKAKNDTTHSRRTVFSYLNNKESVKTLFDEVANKIADRPGGYTRILKTGNRLGDNADMCIIELVDYNELLLGDSKPAKSKTRRSRRGGKKASNDTTKQDENSSQAVDTVSQDSEQTTDNTSEEVVAEESVQVEEATVEEAKDSEAKGEEIEPTAEVETTDDTKDQEETSKKDEESKDSDDDNKK